MCTNIWRQSAKETVRHFWFFPLTRQGNGHEVKQNRLLLNIRKHFCKIFFSVSTNEHWHTLPRKGVETPSMQTLKGHKEMVLGNYLRVALLEQGGGMRWLLEVPCLLSHSLILYQSQNHSCMHLKVSEELLYRWKQIKERLSSETPPNAQTYISLTTKKIQLLGQCDLDN